MPCFCSGSTWSHSPVLDRLRVPERPHFCCSWGSWWDRCPLPGEECLRVSRQLLETTRPSTIAAASPPLSERHCRSPDAGSSASTPPSRVGTMTRPKATAVAAKCRSSRDWSGERSNTMSRPPARDGGRIRHTSASKPCDKSPTRRRIYSLELRTNLCQFQDKSGSEHDGYRRRHPRVRYKLARRRRYIPMVNARKARMINPRPAFHTVTAGTVSTRNQVPAHTYPPTSNESM